MACALPLAIRSRHQGSQHKDAPVALLSLCAPPFTVRVIHSSPDGPRDLKRNPKHVTYEELRRVLEDNRWTIREGTEHGAIAQNGSRTFHCPRPHAKHLLAVSVRRAVKIIEEAG